MQRELKNSHVHFLQKKGFAKVTEIMLVTNMLRNYKLPSHNRMNMFIYPFEDIRHIIDEPPLNKDF